MKLNPLVMVQKEFDGTGIVFDPENNRAMTLNRTGKIIWDGIEKGLSEAQIIDEFVAEFSVDREVAAKDVAAFLELLKDKGLLAD